jgi:hypothetical protein
MNKGSLKKKHYKYFMYTKENTFDTLLRNIVQKIKLCVWGQC